MGNDISDLLLGIAGILGKINDTKTGSHRKNIFGMPYKKTRSQRKRETDAIVKGTEAVINLSKKAYKKISKTEFKNPFATKTKDLNDNNINALKKIKEFIELTKELQKLGHDKKNHDFEKLSRKAKDESKKLFKKIDTAFKKLNKTCAQSNLHEDQISSIIENTQNQAKDLKELIIKYANIHNNFINDAKEYENLLNSNNELNKKLNGQQEIPIS